MTIQLLPADKKLLKRLCAERHLTQAEAVTRGLELLAAQE